MTREELHTRLVRLETQLEGFVEPKHLVTKADVDIRQLNRMIWVFSIAWKGLGVIAGLLLAKVIWPMLGRLPW